MEGPPNQEAMEEDMLQRVCIEGAVLLVARSRFLGRALVDW